MSKKIFAILRSTTLVIFVIALLAFVGFVGLTACSSSAPKASVDLTGSWHQASSDDAATKMTADVSDGHIKIMMYSSIINGLYWDGSFSAKQPKTAFDEVSIAGADALSQDQTKTFTYQNGILSYSFTMLGKTRVIHLYRGA